MDLDDTDRRAGQDRRQRAGVIAGTGARLARHDEVHDHLVRFRPDGTGDPRRQAGGRDRGRCPRRRARRAQGAGDRPQDGAARVQLVGDYGPGIEVEAREAVAGEGLHRRLVVGVVGQRAVRLRIEGRLDAGDRAKQEILVGQRVRALVRPGPDRVQRGFRIGLGGRRGPDARGSPAIQVCAAARSFRAKIATELGGA